MRIITISREFGSGGRELGRRLADIMGIDYYDSEIITTVAKQTGLEFYYIAKKLSGQGWRNYPITFSKTIHSARYMQSDNLDLLLKQKDVIAEIAQLGRDFVIVGRNADIILEKYSPFCIFVCAETQAKIR